MHLVSGESHIYSIEAYQCNDCVLQSGKQADLGDQVPEALKEGVDLRLDGSCHAMPRHQVDVLPLVLLCHSASS